MTFLFVQVLACINQAYPSCIILKGLRIAQSNEAKDFFAAWPAARAAAEAAFDADRVIATRFHEAPTQSAFMSISACQKYLEETMHSHSVQLQVITR